MLIKDNLSGNGMNEAHKVSKEIVVEAPLDLCFASISRQLESPAEWDPLTIHAWPISLTRNRKGAVSLVLLDLGGDILHSGARIDQYKPYTSFSWHTTGSPRIRMSWSLSSQTTRETTINLTTIREQDSFSGQAMVEAKIPAKAEVIRKRPLRT